MTDASFSNFFNMNGPLLGGLTVKSHERTLKQAGETIQKSAGSVIDPLINFIDDNQEVFTGDVQKEISKTTAKCINIGLNLQAEDTKINGKKPTFDIKF